MKTRVLMEQSQYDTKYYPQVQKKFLFWEYWQYVDIYNSIKQHKAICSAFDEGYKECSKEYSEHICEFIQKYTTEAEKKKEKEFLHNKTKVYYAYEHPKD